MIGSTRWSRSVLLLGCTAAGAVGCGGGSSTTPCVARPGAAGGEASCRARAELTHNALPRNGLTREALMAPGTQALLRAIATGPLTADTVRPFQAWIAASEDVRSLMEYVASCALDPGVEIDTGVDVGTDRVRWPGGLGLCGRRSPLGSWAAGPPGDGCKEIVSSCVLARVNAHEKKVVISVRGEPDCLLSLQRNVPVEQAYRENRGTPIGSFESRCDGVSEPERSSPERDCAWSGRFVGSCTPDRDVTLKVAPGTLLRVCKGIYGCDHANTDDTPWYAGVIGSFDRDRVTFRCPRNGVSSSAPSYFSVMLASRDPGVELPGGVDVRIETGGTYPSPEREVFTYREGAFFGNLFVPLDPQAPPTQQLLVGDQYACYSEVWTDGIAHLADRLCAGPDSPCFENPPKPCLWKTRQPGVPARDRSCAAQRCDPQQGYLGCARGGREWRRAITVFLNNPCDLARDIESCRKAYKDAFTPNNW